MHRYGFSPTIHFVSCASLHSAPKTAICKWFYMRAKGGSHMLMMMIHRIEGFNFGYWIYAQTLMILVHIVLAFARHSTLTLAHQKWPRNVRPRPAYVFFLLFSISLVSNSEYHIGIGVNNLSSCISYVFFSYSSSFLHETCAASALHPINTLTITAHSSNDEQVFVVIRSLLFSIHRFSCTSKWYTQCSHRAYR